MGIISKIKSIFRKEPAREQRGTIYFKESEQASAQQASQSLPSSVSVVTVSPSGTQTTISGPTKQTGGTYAKLKGGGSLEGGSSETTTSGGDSSVVPTKSLPSSNTTKSLPSSNTTKDTLTGASTSVTQVAGNKIKLTTPSVQYNPNITSPQKTVSTATTQNVRGVQISDMSFKEKLKSVGIKYTSGSFYREVGRNLYGAEGQLPIIGGVATFFSPLGVFNKPTGDIKTSVPYRGTIISDESFVPPEYKSMTGFERIQNEITSNPNLAKPTEQLVYETGVKTSGDIEKSIRGSYQARINAGEDFTNVSEEYNQEFNKRFNEQFEKNLKSNTLLNRKSVLLENIYSANKPIVNVPKAFETGAVIAGGFVAPVATGAFIASSGFASGYQGISERNILKVGVGFGTGLIGTGFTYGSLGSQIDKIRLSEVIKRQKVVGGEGVRYEYGNQFVDVLKYKGGYSGLNARTNFIGQGVQKGNKFVYGGEQTTIVTGRTYWGNKPFSTTVTKQYAPSTSTIGKVKVLDFGRSVPLGDVSLSISKLSSRDTLKGFATANKKGITGKVGIETGLPFEGKEMFAGIGKRVSMGDKEYVVSLGGKVQRLRVDYIKIKGNLFLKGAGFSVPEASVTKLRVVKPFEDNGVTFISTGGKSVGSKFDNIANSFGDSNQVTKQIQNQINKQSSGFSVPDMSSQIVKSTTLKTGVKSISPLSLLSSQVTFPKSRERQANISVPVVTSLSLYSQTGFSATTSKTTQRSFSGLAQSPQQREEMKQVPFQESVTVPVPPFGRITPAVPPLDNGLFGLPPLLPFGGERVGFGGDIKATRKYQYFPSFKAIIFNIRKRGKSPSPTKIFTGLETRPIFYMGGKKRKKRIKVKGGK